VEFLRAFIHGRLWAKDITSAVGAGDAAASPRNFSGAKFGQIWAKFK